MGIYTSPVATVIMTVIISQQMMPSSSRDQEKGKCQVNLKVCPPGHEFASCDTAGEYRCIQCGDKFFQPNENRLGDKCRLRKICYKAFMKPKHGGSTISDAKCECIDGFHFENEDQRACVPNRECKKGLGQGEYGVCENCIEKMMYSDTSDRLQKCKPLTNCEKNQRCTKRRSNGTFDNVCGPRVRDINDCSSIVSESEGVNSPLKTGLIIGGVALAVVIICLLIALLVCRKKINRKKSRNEPLTEEQLEELKRLILHKCEKNDGLSRKVISESFSQIESRIDRQSWTLAQSLFRNHHIAGKYELLVETYKEKSTKETVKGYLGEWRTWRGDNQTAVKEIFQCLGNCKRDDIVYEICNRLRGDVGDICFDGEGNVIDSRASNRAQNNFYCEFGDLFTCIRKPEKPDIEKEDNPETTNKLLEAQPHVDPHTAGAIYRERPYPSAPVFEETNGLLMEPEVQFHRQYSQPVQATT